tara:strand:+ start:345 stop:644 length:300 start_codon:yes stop_codon:yes gene_type:complete
MAKTKTKEKEVKVNKRAVKIHEKHLKELQGIVNTINAIQFNVGKMEIQKLTALDEIQKYQRKVAEMQELLVREYGSYDVSLEDGTINWPETKKSKENEK